MTDQETSRGVGGVPLRWYAIGIIAPALISAFTQFEFVQNLDGSLIPGLPWGIGRWEIMADILAPAWAISLIVLAALLRRLVGVWPGPQGPPATGWPIRLANDGGDLMAGFQKRIEGRDPKVASA